MEVKQNLSATMAEMESQRNAALNEVCKLRGVVAYLHDTLSVSLNFLAKCAAGLESTENLPETIKSDPMFAELWKRVAPGHQPETQF